jgi:hypothetical protein
MQMILVYQVVFTNKCIAKCILLYKNIPYDMYMYIINLTFDEYYDNLFVEMNNDRSKIQKHGSVVL